MLYIVDKVRLTILATISSIFLLIAATDTQSGENLTSMN